MRFTSGADAATATRPFIVAASPVYLRAVEKDLRVRSEALVSSEQLTVVTSKAWRGELNGQIRVTNAGMMKELNTNMTWLNISLAVRLLQCKNKVQYVG